MSYTNFKGLRCEEASTLSKEQFIACGAPAASIVWHKRDGKHTYLMCASCTYHNVINRGGRLVATSDEDLVEAFRERGLL